MINVMSGLDNEIFRGSPYALEVPVNKIHAVEILYSRHTVNKLQGALVPVRSHEEHFRTNCIR